MTDTPSAAPGWYRDAQGEMRYWDGHAWTGHTASNYRAAPTLGNPAPGAPTAPTTAFNVVDEIGGRPWRSRWQFWLAITVATFLAIGAIGNATTDNSTENASSTTAPTSPGPTSSTEPTKPPIELLYVTNQKDGDSWDASDGKEYRLGLINTPERNEQCGSEATAFTRQFLESGFTANAYSTDTYGRTVAEVFDQDGESLNVALAKSGLGDGRYLEQFRHENPDLGRRLDSALASAATPDCRKAVAPAPLVNKPSAAPKAASDCMPGYSPCLPIVDDLDCGDIGRPVKVTGDDPYRLDRDKDGTGCDS